MHLVRLIYYSENRLDAVGGQSQLDVLKDILEASQRNNAKRAITGALVFDDLWFYQALEGEREVVWQTFMTILDDPRHGEVVLGECVAIETRLFGQWAMRLARPNALTRPLFDRFTVAGVVRPSLMGSGRHPRHPAGLPRQDEPRRRGSGLAGHHRLRRQRDGQQQRILAGAGRELHADRQAVGAFADGQRQARQLQLRPASG